MGQVVFGHGTDESRPLLKRAMPALPLLPIAFLVYAPALGGGFLWDDDRAILGNANLRPLGSLWNLWVGRGDFDYLPLKNSPFWLIHQCCGPAPAPHHAFNVAIHAANAVRRWRVLRRLEIPGARLAGLIFPVHPTQVESVARVSACEDTLPAPMYVFLRAGTAAAAATAAHLSASPASDTGAGAPLAGRLRGAAPIVRSRSGRCAVYWYRKTTSMR